MGQMMLDGEGSWQLHVLRLNMATELGRSISKIVKCIQNHRAFPFFPVSASFRPRKIGDKAVQPKFVAATSFHRWVFDQFNPVEGSSLTSHGCHRRDDPHVDPDWDPHHGSACFPRAVGMSFGGMSSRPIPKSSN